MPLDDFPVLTADPPHGGRHGGAAEPSGSAAPPRRTELRWVGYGLEIVPPLATVNADVSWQLAGMSRCPRLVLS